MGELVRFNFEKTLEDFFDDLDEHGTVHLDIGAALSGEEIYVDGTLEVSSKAVCSRCLVSFDYTFRTDFKEAFTLLKGPPVEESPKRLAEDTANRLTVTGDYLYISEYIRQLIVLAQEYSPLCKTDCKGICAGCGADLNQSACSCSSDHSNIDARLLKLKDFGSGSQAK